MASILASCCAAAASTSSLRSTTSARAPGPLWQVAVAARRHFTSSTSSDVQQQSALSTSSSSSPSPTAGLDQLIVGDAPIPSSAPAPPPRPSFTPSFSAQRQRRGTPPSSGSVYTSQINKQANDHPYRLHVHASKHNTILSLCRDLPPPPIEGKGSAPRGVLERAQEGQGFGNPDADPELYDKSTNKTYGQTVARTSCGQLGFRKAQRSTFEAATKTALRMFDMIDGLEEGRDRKRKDGSRVTDPKVTGIELIFKGYGQGRDAIVAALQTDRGKRVGALVRRVTDATPIKVGGTRPRKRRMLSPPLDLSRKRRP